MIDVGDCMLIETNRDANGYMQSHLHVVVLEIEAFTQNTIIVVVETVRSEKIDKTTVLKPGDHEFIKKESFVNYRRAKTISVSTLQRLIEQKIAIKKEPINSDLLQRIQWGIKKSPFTSMEVLSMYENYIFGKLKK